MRLPSALVVLLTISTAQAAPSDERMRELLAFAGTAMGVRYHDVDLPVIRYMTTEQMQITIYGVDKFNRLQADERIGMVEPQALYEPDTQTMYLNKATDYADPANEYELVHEFVHHLQAVHGHYETFACVRASEREAYRVSNLWVMATGLGKAKDPLTVHYISQCTDQ